jgi:predicted  nucleic acid-binding Zn-ribbon protein
MQSYLDLQKQLDDIYDDIFSGPTPEFPEEDAKEKQSNNALSAYVTTKTAFELHQKALGLLEQATATMTAGLQQVDKALQSGDMNHLRALNKGRELVQQSKMTVDQLVQLGADVIELPPEANPRTMEVTSNLGDVWGKVDITGGRQEVARCTAALNNCLSQAKERKYYLSKELKRKGEEMDEARTELQKVRKGIFEEVMGDDLVKGS